MVVRRSDRVWVWLCVRLWVGDGVGGGVVVCVGVCVGAGVRGGVLGYVARQVEVEDMQRG